MFTMRFDMRAPEFGGSTTDLYRAAIEMAAWAESRGGVAAVISEHHTSPDGYIPSPMLLASAMAARTQQLYISLAAALLPFYDPIRLAEDMNVLDIISSGRVSYVFGHRLPPGGVRAVRPRHEAARRASPRRSCSCCWRHARVSRSCTRAGASTSRRRR